MWWKGFLFKSVFEKGWNNQSPRRDFHPLDNDTFARRTNRSDFLMSGCASGVLNPQVSKVGPVLLYVFGHQVPLRATVPNVILLPERLVTYSVSTLY